MTDYVKSTNFASKDSLASGNPLKIVKGTEIDTEFNNIATAISTKADSSSPTVTGNITLSNGTANGVAYLNGSKEVITGSALVFDGTNFSSSGTVSATKLIPTGGTATGNGMYLPTSNTLAWSNNGTETMRLDSSGNLGLGVTPSAWGGGGNKVLEIGAYGSYIASNTAGPVTYIGANNYWNGSNWIYKSSSYASQYQATLGGHQWYTAPSGTAGNAISFTQAMTLDASGNLGIGTSSPLSKLQVAGAKALASGAYGSSTMLIGTYIGESTDGNLYAEVDMRRWTGAATNHGAGRISVDDSANMIFFANVTSTNTYATTERMRLDTSGNLLVGTTDAADNSGPGIKIAPSATASYITVTMNTSGANNTYHLYNINATNNGYRFYVGSDGGIRNYSANNVNLSDERVKTDIAQAGDYLAKICAIPVRTFRYKDQGDNLEKTLGVIAQEVEEVAPELVNNEGFGETPEDGVPLKTIYQTDLQYALMKCIQELKAEVDSLKAGK